MDKLSEIMDAKRREISSYARPFSDDELGDLSKHRTMPRFRDALQTKGRITLIAEIKRASPSLGQICENIDAVAQAKAYADAGADCLSVLTETKYFNGNLKDLTEVVRNQSLRLQPLPCIRKDFIVHPYQILESVRAGASCILIIVGGLSDQEIVPIHNAAKLANLDVLFEVHNEAELDRALQHNANLVGVNSRNLATFQIDLCVAERLIPKIPNSVIKVAESGIKSAHDASRMRAAGANALLVGEYLMRSADISATINTLKYA